MEYTQNIDSVLALTDELNRLHIENENLRRIVQVWPSRLPSYGFAGS